MTTGLDALLTLSERQLGVLQPRPEATLHVGGPIKSDGGLTTGSITTGTITASGLQVNGNAAVTGSITASGDIYGRWLHTTDGSNGVVQADNGSLYLRSAGGGYQFDSGGMANFTGGVTTTGLTVNGNASVSGTLTAGTVTGYVQPTSLYSTGKITTAVSETTGIASGGSSAPLEVGVTGGGAAKISFHRHGAFAAFFGIDTDNQWRIGGWSMGAAAYRILDDRDYSVGAAGSKLVQRDPNGYITNTYINLTADRVESGAPAYVAGQNGDNYLRWYAKSLVGPPGLMETHGYFGAGQIGPGATVNRTTGINANGCGVTHDGTSIYVQRYGWYVITARSYSGDNTWDDGRYAEMRIMTAGGNVGGNHCANPKGGSGTYVQNYAKVLLNVGGQIYFQHYQNISYSPTWDGGFWSVIFVPTSGGP